MHERMNAHWRVIPDVNTTHKQNIIQQNSLIVFTLKGLSPLCVNMCLWSQLWLVDGVLYTLQPFHRHTNTWGTNRDGGEERSRRSCRHSEQMHNETIHGEKSRRINIRHCKATVRGHFIAKTAWRLRDRKTTRASQIIYVEMFKPKFHSLESGVFLKCSLQVEELCVFLGSLMSYSRQRKCEHVTITAD